MHTIHILFLALAGNLTLSAFAQTRLISDNFVAITVKSSGADQIAVSGSNVYRQLVHQNLYTDSAAGGLHFSERSFSTGYLTLPDISIAAPGKSVTISFTIHYPEGAGDKNAGLRIGIYNTRGDIRTALSNDAGNPDGDTAQGYYVTLSPGGAGKVWSPASLNVGKDLGNRKVTQYNSVLGGVPDSTVGLGSFERTVPFGSTPQKITLTVTRTASGVVVSGESAGDTFESKEDADAPFTTFDTFIFGNGGSSGPWRMSDLVISTSAAR